MFTGLNSMAGALLLGIIKTFSKEPISDFTGAFIIKVTVFGTISTGLEFALEQSTGMVQTNVSFGAMTIGTTLGVF